MVARLRMIEDCSRWPMYPWLPLTHKRERIHGIPKCGLMVPVEGCETTVFLAILGEVRSVQETMQCDKVVYDSLDALEAHWQVD